MLLNEDHAGKASYKPLRSHKSLSCRDICRYWLTSDLWLAQTSVHKEETSWDNEYLDNTAVKKESMTWSAEDLRKEDLESLLSQQFDLSVKFSSYNVQALTQPGDNYSSTMLAVDVILSNNSKKHQKLSLVAKLMPPTKFLREVINIDVTFRKEVNTYMLVFPEFYNLQRENGIPENEILDVFPKLYGSRINRLGDIHKKADDSAILLLENLKISGYATGDRRNGLNLKHIELGVSKLAKFHAISVALKVLKPQVFKETVLKACESFQIASQVDETGLPKWVNSTLRYVKEIPECEPFLQRIENALILSVKKTLPPTEPFAAFIHNDLSASPDVIESHYDDLIQLYHREFINFLKNLGCKTETFSFEKLQDEIRLHGSSEFAHILMMFKFICADKSKLPELSNDNIEELLEINTGAMFMQKTPLCQLNVPKLYDTNGESWKGIKLWGCFPASAVNELDRSSGTLNEKGYSSILCICTAPRKSIDFMSSKFDSLLSEINNVKVELKEVRKENDFLKHEIKELSVRLQDLEQYNRRDNIVLYGVPSTNNES
ncbi:hypothetical protein ANN_02561 [Periplaneta americana]|uniref:CHK kinase-like domain-containing protein n=1 Tax=Periplaneta americana TaxID=6978 RepID=A0ABQ8TWN0_PERAM|nr:hypothetical protein ANN_02561 [Periplaneta americana]